MSDKMKLYPIHECASAVRHLLNQPGVNVHQQWICDHCGIKQTMETPNVFYKTGQCEECKKVTNIEKAGMNYMIHANLKEWTNPPRPDLH